MKYQVEVKGEFYHMFCTPVVFLIMNELRC